MGAARSLRLGTLAEAAGDLVLEVSGDRTTAVTGLQRDSRLVGPGDLFFCVPGTVTDGHRFAPEAVRRGAVALCVQRRLELNHPQVVVTDVRRAMARIAAQFYGHPARHMTLIGVTGTNGKTTTTYLVEAVLRSAGHTTGLVGTVETRTAGQARPGVRTTPDSLELQDLLAEMRDAGVTAVAMEVTSHGLALHRVEGLRFAAAAFTNLSQDHLDFHSTMEDYFAAKRSLFIPERAERAAANADDPYGRRLLEAAEVPMLSFGLAENADVHPAEVRSHPGGQEAVVTTPLGEFKLRSALVGRFNLYNCLAAAAVCLQADVSLEAIAEGIASVRGVPGRFETVDCGQPFTVVVDYAHKPGALENVLAEARRLAEGGGRVLCVFGAGGDRDRSKRPVMGEVAARLADVVVVTSDNPRSEDPLAIIGEIVEGIRSARPEGPDRVVVDRREAIELAVGMARPGDVVVVAGKGHETGQEIAGRVLPFDDRAAVREGLRALGHGEG